MKKLILIFIITVFSFCIFSQTADELYDQASKFRDSEYDKAIELYSQVIKLKADHYKAFYYRGKCYFEKNMLDEAIKDFTDTIKINSKYHYAYFRRGIVYKQKGDFENAIKDYKSAVEIKRDYNDAYRELGFIYILMEQNGKAMGYLDKALIGKGKESYANMYKGFIYYAKNDFKNANDYFINAITINNDNCDINFFYLINSFHISEQAFNNALVLVKNNKMLIKDKNGWEYSVLSFLTNEIDETELIKKTSNDDHLLSEAFYFISYKNLIAGNKEKAVEYFKKCIEKNKVYCIYFIASKAALKNNKL